MNIKGMKDFGQYEELTDRLRSLLNGYKDGLPFFKEIIQNADDANATTIKFCFDKRNHSQWMNKEKLLDEGMMESQGIALFVYNDAMFTTDDFNNLVKLGGCTKRDKCDKIGKFGLGFSSVFNITDNPSIISGDSMVILDPNLSFLDNLIHNKSQPGKRIDFGSFDTTQYVDQFKPYENIFGCEIFQKPFDYQGTLFRFPLRSKPSKISNTIYNSDTQIRDLFVKLLDCVDSILLFTQSVRVIEFYMTTDEDNQTMKLLFKLEKNLEKCLSNQHYDNEIVELTKNSSILRNSAALVRQNSKSDQNIETKMIVRTMFQMEPKQFSLFFNTSTNLSNCVSYWLVVSSFKSIYLTDDKEFIPCVGIGVELEKQGNKYLLKSLQSNGSAFCFLPLSIETSLKYHINGLFALSEDRQRFFDLSKDEKANSPKHKWNENILQPLVDNLALTIKTFYDYRHIIETSGNHVSNIIENFFPLGNTINYFLRFEEVFYNLLASDTDKLLKEFLGLPKNKCVFVDFLLRNQQIQTLSVSILNDIFNATCNDSNIIEIPSQYLEKFKSKLKKEAFMDSDKLLRILIDNRQLISLDSYEKILIYFLENELVDYNNNINKNLNFIINLPCIPTRQRSFKAVTSLINPKANKFYDRLFDHADDPFPSQNICANEKAMLALQKAGLINNLTDNMIVNLAAKVEIFYKSDQVKSEDFSDNLFECIKSMNNSVVFGKLNHIKWMFAKPKPNNWFLPWNAVCGKNVYRPVDLFNQKYTNILACVSPIMKIDYPSQVDLTLEQKVMHGISQVGLLYKHFQSSHFQMTNDQKLNCLMFYKELLTILNQYAINDQCISHIKNTLCPNWVYCPDSKDTHFFSIECLALNVKNTAEPYFMKFPSIYSEFKSFFQRMGLKSHFGLKFLNEKLFNLRQNFDTNPLDKESKDYCLNIINEMIYVNDSGLDSTSIQQLREAGESFYLPDENWIMRDIASLHFKCEESFSLDEIYVLNPNVLANKFGIKDYKSTFLNGIGERFGQVENLIDRIKSLLQSYSNNFCIFKELLQNSDDAKATSACFIIDERQLDKNKIFSDSFADLQGPSLCYWNDSIFTENDLQGIISLGKGSKQQSIESIGRFGVGYNSVYHVTDSPQFISNFDDYVIFDPMCKYIPGILKSDPGLRVRGAKKRLNNSLFSDVIKGFDINSKFYLENATMFRLPLRTRASDISGKTFSSNDIKVLMKEFIKSAKECLLFLRNVKQLSFYTVDKNGNLFEDEVVTVKIESENDKIERLRFESELKNAYVSSQEIHSVGYARSIYKLGIKSKSSESKYLIMEQYGFNSKTQSDIELAKMFKGSKCFPKASIAFNLDTLSKKYSPENYKMYCYLPLEQSSPICCHVNGNWALHLDNRKGLYEYNQRTENVDKATAKSSTEWNLLLVNKIILPLYIELIEKLQNLGLEESSIAENFIYLFPSQLTKHQQLEKYFETFFEEFYKTVYKLKFIPDNTTSKSLKWNKPEEIVYFNPLKSQMKLYGQSELQTNKIYNALLDAGVKLMPEHFEILSNDFQVYGKISMKEPQVDANKILNIFKSIKVDLVGKDVSNTLFKDVSVVKCFLQYFIELDVVFQLANAALLLTKDNKLREFSPNNIVIKYKEPEVFVNNFNLFLHEDLFELFEKFKNDKNISVFVYQYFKDIAITDLGRILPSELDKTFNNNEKPYPEDKPKIELIEQVWKIIEKENNSTNQYPYIQQNKQVIIRILEPIKNWALIPTIFDSKKFLLPLSKRNSVILNEYSEFMNIFKKVNHLKNQTVTFLNSLTDYKWMKQICVNFNDQNDVFEFLNNNPHFFNKKDCLGSKSEMNIYCNIMLNFLNDSIRENIQNIKNTKKTKNRRSEFVITYLLSNITSYTMDEIRRIIGELEIFTDIFKRTDSLSKRSMEKNLLIDFQDTSSKNLFQSIIQNETTLCDLISFANDEDIFIIENTSSHKKLNSFLELKTINMEQFYELFFNWTLKNESRNQINKDHIGIIINLIKIYSKLNNQNLLNVLKKIKFIKIQDQYFRANECFYSKTLFEFAYKDRILPKEFYESDWLNFAKDLGLQISYNAENLLEITSLIEAKYKNDEIDLKKVNELAKNVCEEIKNLMDENTDETYDLIKSIRTIKFIPNGILFDKYKIYKKFTLKKESIICMKNSAFDENKEFCWLESPILPNYCDFLNNESNYAGTINKIDDELVKSHFNVLLSQLKEEGAVDRLTESDHTFLVRIFKLHYSKLAKMIEKKIKVNEFADMDIVLNVNCNTKKSQLSPAKIFVRTLDASDTIEGLMKPIPKEYGEYWNLFKELGSKESVEFDMCVSYLEYYYNVSTENGQLTEKEYKDVLILLKFLFYENLLSNENKENIKLYLPNASRQMVESGLLYYSDNHQKYDLTSNLTVKSLLLFDLKDLVLFVENRKNDMPENQDHFLKQVILEQLNWNKLFSFFPFFDKNPGTIPKPLKSSIEEKIECDCLSDMDKHKISNVLSSSTFLTAFTDLVQKTFVDNPNDSIGTYFAEEIKQKIIDLLSNIEIYLLDSIKTTTFLRLNEEKLCETERAMFVLNKKNKQFLIKNSLKEDLEFFVSIMISNEMKNLILESENTLVKFFMNNYHQRDRIFLHFLAKLLKSSTKNYEDILNQVDLDLFH